MNKVNKVLMLAVALSVFVSMPVKSGTFDNYEKAQTRTSMKCYIGNRTNRISTDGQRVFFDGAEMKNKKGLYSKDRKVEKHPSKLLFSVKDWDMEIIVDFSAKQLSYKVLTSAGIQSSTSKCYNV